jgi:hypothetical protein
VRQWLKRSKTRGCQCLFQNKLAQSWYLVRRLWKAHQLSVKFLFSFSFSFSFLSSVFIWAAFEVLGTAFAFWAALHPAEEQFMGRAWRAHEFYFSFHFFFFSFHFGLRAFCFASTVVWAAKGRLCTISDVFSEENNWIETMKAKCHIKWKEVTNKSVQ